MTFLSKKKKKMKKQQIERWFSEEEMILVVVVEITLKKNLNALFFCLNFVHLQLKKNKITRNWSIIHEDLSKTFYYYIWSCTIHFILISCNTQTKTDHQN